MTHGAFVQAFFKHKPPCTVEKRVFCMYTVCRKETRHSPLFHVAHVPPHSLDFALRVCSILTRDSLALHALEMSVPRFARLGPRPTSRRAVAWDEHGCIAIAGGRSIAVLHRRNVRQFRLVHCERGREGQEGREGREGRARGQKGGMKK